MPDENPKTQKARVKRKRAEGRKPGNVIKQRSEPVVRLDAARDSLKLTVEDADAALRKARAKIRENTGTPLTRHQQMLVASAVADFDRTAGPDATGDKLREAFEEQYTPLAPELRMHFMRAVMPPVPVLHVAAELST